MLASKEVKQPVKPIVSKANKNEVQGIKRPDNFIHSPLFLQRYVGNSALQPPPTKLQRQCACEKETLKLQRQAVGEQGGFEVPPLVHEVLRSPGQPLDEQTRAFMEPRFGHDFSRVRVHTDDKAAESARAVSARAYTVGRYVVMGQGEYAPGTDVGRRLLAHELVHVVQQSGGERLQRLQVGAVGDVYEREAEGVAELIVGMSQPNGRGVSLRSTYSALTTASRITNISPKFDYEIFADRIHRAIIGWGTDEETVYRTLQMLDQSQAAIDELMKVYLKKYKVSLLDDIYDDFSGEELEYVLQLLNMGTSGSKQRIIPIQKILANFTLAATRIRKAFEGIGTDEEAIFAVLLPLKQNTLDLQNEYYRLYQENLRDRLLDEMSSTELEYALELLETPYEHYIHEGNEKLAGVPFGSFGDISDFCMAEAQETSIGTKWKYWYDKEYWEPDVDQVQRSCKVKLLSGKSPADAIDAIFEYQDRWKIACAEFVQIVHLYALRHTLGNKRFDKQVGSNGFTLEVRRRQSTGITTKITFSRKNPIEQMVRSDTKHPDQRTVDEVLAKAPIGSRVRWTNISGVSLNQPNPWEHENTIKLGPNKFGAHGTATGIFSTKNTHTREEIELFTARGTNPKADMNYVKANIFISEIEVFRNLLQPT